MSDKNQHLTMEQQEFIFKTKVELLAEVVNAAFDKLTA